MIASNVKVSSRHAYFMRKQYFLYDVFVAALISVLAGYLLRAVPLMPFCTWRVPGLLSLIEYAHVLIPHNLQLPDRAEQGALSCL